MTLPVKSNGVLTTLLTSLDAIPKFEGRVTDVNIGCNEAGNFYIHVVMGNKAIRYHFYSEGYIQCFRDDADGKGMVYVKTIGSVGGGLKFYKTFRTFRSKNSISKLTQERRLAI